MDYKLNKKINIKKYKLIFILGELTGYETVKICKNDNWKHD